MTARQERALILKPGQSGCIQYPVSHTATAHRLACNGPGGAIVIAVSFHGKPMNLGTERRTLQDIQGMVIPGRALRGSLVSICVRNEGRNNITLLSPLVGTTSHLDPEET